MKQLILKIAVLFSFITVVQIYAQEDMEKLKASIQEGNDKYAKAMLAGDAATLNSFYTDDAIVLPSYSPMQKGIDAIKNASAMDAQSGNKMTEFTLTATDVFENGDWVYEVGKYSLTMEIKGMNDPYKDEGKFLTLFEKQSDGSLKIKADIWNSDINPWATMGKMGEEKK
ncbi:MAG: DUF4440 domain-containing protein [Bacteroidetes bacterium]|nr:DUF4440 domain-containing protein [Bacteroidota bacterium]